MRTALDTNILSAVWSGEAVGRELVHLLGALQREGPLVVCGPVYAELCAHPLASQAFIDQYLETRRIGVDFEIGRGVWDLAAKAYADYSTRRRESSGGQSKRLLADFIIGSHALTNADRLLTLDRDRYALAFPNLKMIP